jgi:hypothetical protein
LLPHKINYTFNKFYDTKVIDFSGNGNPPVKDAPGNPDQYLKGTIIID